VAKQDYYEALGVSRDVDADGLKKAYRRIAMQCHPDRNPDKAAEERFKVASEAYEILSDPEKKAAYDRYGHAGVDPQVGAGFDVGAQFSHIFDDVLGDLFGGGRRRPSRGADLEYSMELELEQVVKGDSVKLRVPTMVTCEDCEGSGARRGSQTVGCQACGGSGRIRHRQGFFSVQRECPQCGGAGRVIEDPCRACNGQGRRRQARSLEVSIPPGVDTGDRIRLSGKGEAGPQGRPPGDLYVRIQIRKHPHFERDHQNLFSRAPVDMTLAALGGEVEVPTLDGKVKLTVPAGTHSGSLFRVPGRGLPPVHGEGRGDLFCRVMVETPQNLSPEQRELLEKFRQTLGPSAAAPKDSDDEPQTQAAGKEQGGAGKQESEGGKASSAAGSKPKPKKRKKEERKGTSRGRGRDRGGWFGSSRAAGNEKS